MQLVSKPARLRSVSKLVQARRLTPDRCFRHDRFLFRSGRNFFDAFHDLGRLFDDRRFATELNSATSCHRRGKTFDNWLLKNRLRFFGSGMTSATDSMTCGLDRFNFRRGREY